MPQRFSQQRERIYQTVLESRAIPRRRWSISS